MLHVAVTDVPWRLLPEEYGKPGTISRHFRRLAHAGLWARLLEALCDPKAPQALRAIEYWLCRAARRAMRLLKMAGLDLAQRLGLLSALPMVPVRGMPRTLPNRGLSETLFRRVDALLDRILAGSHPPPGLLRRLGRALAIAGGRRVWSKRFAPP